MPAIALNHYNLRAPHDLMVQLKTFYCDVIGLENGYRPPFNSVGFWLYAGGHPILHLSLTREGDAIHTNATTLDHIAFSCLDQADMEARLKAHNLSYKVAVHTPIEPVQIFFKDPAGNGVELNFAPDATPDAASNFITKAA